MRSVGLEDGPMGNSVSERRSSVMRELSNQVSDAENDSTAEAAVNQLTGARCFDFNSFSLFFFI